MAQPITRVGVAQNLGSMLVKAKYHIQRMRRDPREGMTLGFYLMSRLVPGNGNSLYSCDQDIPTTLSTFITTLSAFVFCP